MGLIYLVTNVANNKRYIGQSIRSITGRKVEHKYNAFTLKKNYPLYSAMRKYGWNSFSWKILLIVENSELDYYEKELISSLKTLDRGVGYNLKPGGNSVKFTDAMKKKISASNMGKKTKPIIIVNVLTGEEMSGYFRDFRRKKLVSNAMFKNYTSKLGWKLKS